MRVFSLIPVCFIAITSFVAAAPVADSSNAVPALATSHANIQHVVDIVSTVTSQLEPLSNQFSSATKSSHPDVNRISTIVSQMSGIISKNAAQLQTAAQAHVNTEGAGDVLPAVEGLATPLNNILKDSNIVLEDSLHNALPGIDALLKNMRSLVTPLVTMSGGSMATHLAPLCNAIGNTLAKVLAQSGN